MRVAMCAREVQRQRQLQHGAAQQSQDGEASAEGVSLPSVDWEVLGGESEGADNGGGEGGSETGSEDEDVLLVVLDAMAVQTDGDAIPATDDDAVPASLEEAADELSGPAATCVVCDVRDDADIDRAVTPEAPTAQAGQQPTELGTVAEGATRAGAAAEGASAREGVVAGAVAQGAAAKGAATGGAAAEGAAAEGTAAEGAPTPYHVFCQEQRLLLTDHVRVFCQDPLGLRERERLLGQRWKSLSEAERARYQVTPGAASSFLVQLPTTARPAVAQGATVEGVAAEGAVAAGAASLLLGFAPDPCYQATQAQQQEVLWAQQAEQRHQQHQQELAQWEAVRRSHQQLIADQQAQAQVAQQVLAQAARVAPAVNDDFLRARLVRAIAAVLVHAATCKNVLCPVPHCEKMKKNHAHFVECNTVECMLCLKLKPLLYVHAQHCAAAPGEPCVVTWCARAKREFTMVVHRQASAQRQQLSRRQRAMCGSGPPNMMNAAGASAVASAGASAAGQSSVIDLTGDDDVPPPPPPPKWQRPATQPGTPLPGPQGSATPEPPVTPLSSDPAKADRLARYLLVIAHAMKCNNGHGCGMPECRRTKDLVVNHTRYCTQGDACLFPRCAISKKLMLHHRQCRDQACAICLPLRRCLAATKMSADNSSAQPPPQVRRPTQSKKGEVELASVPQVSKKGEDEEPFLRRGGRTRIRTDAFDTQWYEGPSLCSLLAMREATDAVGREFLVRWRGHSPEEDSWERESNIDERLVRAFVSARPDNAKVSRPALPGASASSDALPAAANATAPAPQQGTARKKRRVDQTGSASATLPPSWLSGAPKEQRIGDRLPVCSALPTGGDLATDRANRCADAHIAGLTRPATASTSHAEAATAMAERNRAAAAKAAMEAASEEMSTGEGMALRCCILGCKEKLIQCRGLKHVGCAVGRAESGHVLCVPCLGRWFSSQAALRDESGLSKQTRRTCPVCQAELRTTGSEMRGVGADQYAMGLQKVAGTWPEVATEAWA